jgi:hypothetical protein
MSASPLDSDNLDTKEICKWRVSKDCIRIGEKNQFVGRTCPACVQEKAKQYYFENRDRILERNKARQKRNYVSRKLIKANHIAEIQAQIAKEAEAQIAKEAEVVPQHPWVKKEAEVQATL